MKKIVIPVVASMLSLGLTFSSLAAEKLETPVVRWSTEREALPEWSTVENSGGKYKVEAYLNGERIYRSTHHTGVIGNEREWLKAGGFVSYVEDSGSYTFKVQALGDGENTEDSEWSELSETWEFANPSIEFEPLKSLKWDGTSAVWEYSESKAMEMYEDYILGCELTLFGVTADGDEDQLVTHHGLDGTEYDQAEWIIDEDGEYVKFGLSARIISNTPSVILHSEEITASTYYNVVDENADIKNALDEILATDSDAVIASAPNALAKDIKKLQVAMQTDESVVERVADLEATYVDLMGIETDIQVSEDVSDEMDKNKIKLVGLGLNADVDSDEVTFHVTKPEKEVMVDEKAYKDTIQFDFGLTGAVKKLNVPIQITVPIPEKINAEHFAIIHCHKDGTLEEIDPFTMIIDEEERTVTFTVTSFSTFVFANYAETDDNDKTPDTDTVKKPSYSRDDNDDDNDYVSAVAEPKFVPSAEGQWCQDEKGWWFKLSDGRWPSNGWAILPWSNENAWYFFDAEGYMQTGWVFWNGDWYYLSPASGVDNGRMCTGWQMVDGLWYYFNAEPGAANGAMLYNTTTPDNYNVDENGVWIQ